MLIVFPLATAVVLLIAGLSKLGDPGALARAARDFRLPRAATSIAAARTLIGGEIAIGVAMLVASDAWLVAASGAAVLVFAGFLGLAIVAVVRRDDISCGCFGVLSEGRAGWAMVGRNALLLGVSVGAVVFGVDGPGSVPTALARLGADDAAWLGLAAAVAAGAGVIAALRRVDARTRGPVPLPADGGGTTRPDFEVVRADGSIVSSRALSRMRPQLLLFVRPGCASCESLMDAVPRLSDALAPVIDVVVAVDAPPAVFLPAREALRGQSVFAIASAKEKLGVTRTPSAVVIDAGGTVRTGPAAGRSEINDLLEGLSGEYVVAPGDSGAGAAVAG